MPQALDSRVSGYQFYRSELFFCSDFDSATFVSSKTKKQCSAVVLVNTWIALRLPVLCFLIF